MSLGRLSSSQPIHENPIVPYCMMPGTIPAGVSVPLHSHHAVKSFYNIYSAGLFKWSRTKAAISGGSM
jgi:hypothetical protein